MLKAVAVALGSELRARLVFVGGCATPLYITDPITLEGVRATDDVDVIVDLAGFAEWAELMGQLRERGGYAADPLAKADIHLVAAAHVAAGVAY